MSDLDSRLSGLAATMQPKAMPVILDEEGYVGWLSRTNSAAFAKPYLSQLMKAARVELRLHQLLQKMLQSYYTLSNYCNNLEKWCATQSVENGSQV